ncbi:MAG TPA: alpha/beta hydrolase [Solirubrobacteraceae bacterium]|nr:alpha/beta hydrolase [Solirubrobacteraceae bacterium]
MDRPLPEVTGVAHSYPETSRVRLHVAQAGAGPPLVLLHGWPQHWYEWRDLIPPLSERYRVICPDLPGFGWSGTPEHGYDKETLARDILALLDQLGIERCYLAGHDWGGWIGFLICQLAPERVERYLALNIALPFARPGNPLGLWRLWYQWVLGAPLLGQRTAHWISQHPATMTRWAGAQRAWSQDEAESFLGQFSEPARARATVALYRSFQLVDLPKVVRGKYRRLGLTTPSLVLHGVRDQVVRPGNLRADGAATDLTVELVENSGHFIVDEQPELVLARAQEFFGAGGLA